MSSILIGNISNVHGIKGEIKVYPYTDDINNLSKLKTIFLDETLKLKYDVTRCRVHKNMLIMKLNGIDNIDEALKLKTKDIYIDKSKLEKLDDDTYYVEDLIGMQVIDENNKKIGILEYVFNTGANDVYEIKLSENNKKVYIPAIKDVIKSVDIKNKKLHIVMMKGLM